MRITMDDGVELAVQVAGSGPGLLLVHGFGGAKEDFGDHVDALAERHTVVTFDHRGHGASGKPDDLAAYSFARLRADTLAIAEALDLARFRLLGHSMGGMIARRIAVDHPERVDALVMMDTAPGPLPAFDPELIEVGAQHALQHSKAALRELLDMTDPLGNEAHQRVLRERPGYQEFNDRKWDDLSVSMWVALVREIARQPDELDLMRTLPMPVLVLVGALDRDFLPAARAMADAIPHASLVVLDGAGHSPQFEQPRAWFDALDSFLRSVPVRA